MNELMTVDELAQHLRVTKKTIYRLLKRGGNPGDQNRPAVEIRQGSTWPMAGAKFD